MKAEAAQRLATFGEYTAEIHQIFTEDKHEQLLSVRARRVAHFQAA